MAHLKREPGSINYQLYGSKGSMETDRWDGGQLHVYLEGDRNCIGEHIKYCPEFKIKDAAGAGHGGGDYFTTYYFINAILGDEDARANCIDVYQAIDMCIPGILAYRSIVQRQYSTGYTGSAAKKTYVDAYKNDTFCTFQRIGRRYCWVPKIIFILRMT